MQPNLQRFMAALLERTIDLVEEAAHRRAVQAFLDELRPGLQPGDCPAPRPEFTMFSRIEMAPATEVMEIVFTPEGCAFFRAWLRRRGIEPVMGTS